MSIHNRVKDLFGQQRHELLSVFYTAGFPRLEDTPRIAGLLERSGVDMIEIGIPFSDPIADGPVIQESNTIALGNGMTVKKLLEQVREIRKTVKIPIVLMGYLNPVVQYGIESFCRDAANAGVDGLILPDMPAEEYRRAYRKFFDENNLTITFLISPTTSPERIRQIDEATNGFIYAVSSSSTTGAKLSFSKEQEDYFEEIRKMKLKNPFMIGFGISNRETFSLACLHGSGAIVGSAFISLLRTSTDFEKDILKFVTNLKGKSNE